jgi:hypothetical protein
MAESPAKFDPWTELRVLGKWALRADIDGATFTNSWADFPGLGFDAGNAVYITSNQYAVGGDFQYAKMRIRDKLALYSGSALTWWDFWNWTNSDGSGVFTCLTELLRN